MLMQEKAGVDGTNAINWCQVSRLILHRHLILVTATPHSGNEGAFRSLLTFLEKDFKNLPEELAGKQHEQDRRRLAAHFVQRRRGDIRSYLQADTPFPEREESEQTYKLSADYKRLIDKVMRYAREIVIDPDDSNKHHQRVRWWSALALLRSMSSSPAAAVATLRSRASVADTGTADEADEIGRHTVLDLMDNDTGEGIDLVPGSDIEEEAGDEQKIRRRLLEMAREAEALKGAKDDKLQKAIKLVDTLIKDGYQPIVFCRFIPTAEYVACSTAGAFAEKCANRRSDRAAAARRTRKPYSTTCRVLPARTGVYRLPE